MGKFDDKQNFFNRELSWLSFNGRVLEEAQDDSNPLMERLKFLAISSSNLDEFFMIRVANLKQQVDIGYSKPDNKSGLDPVEQLCAIEHRVHQMVEKQYEELYASILPALRTEGIEFLGAEQLNESQGVFVDTYFRERIFPVLTPMAIDSSRPFPHLQNKTLNLTVRLEGKEGDELFALVQVPALLLRYVQLPSKEHTYSFILLEEIIRHHIVKLFLGTKILSVHAFRITRDADLPSNDEEAEDLLEEMEVELKKRERGRVVRLEIEDTIIDNVKAFLMESLEVEEGDIYSEKGPLDLSFLLRFTRIEGFGHLRYQPLPPQPVLDLLGEEDLFAAISKKDILLHHPFESFDSVVAFVQKAADDPHVLAIKQTLYRVSADSPIIQALSRAANRGKQVMVLVEIKARFDEENNIAWAKKLEKAGCHVIFGMAGLKTHSKITLVVRQVGEAIKRYVHLATGNYNETTAGLYTDLGMFTARPEVGEDASIFFNYLTGYAEPPSLKVLTMAPSGLKAKFLTLIQNEIKKNTPDQPGRIIAKMNSLTDKDIIMALFAASQAGVKIDLIVRGTCCLRPGVKGLSENIRVISIVGRWLEHSRVYYFQNGGDDELVFLSSADLMTRNLMKRVEILFPVLDLSLRERLREILSIQLQDNVKARELLPDGTYLRVARQEQPSLHSQLYIYQKTAHSVERKAKEILRYSY